MSWLQSGIVLLVTGILVRSLVQLRAFRSGPPAPFVTAGWSLVYLLHVSALGAFLVGMFEDLLTGLLCVAGACHSLWSTTRRKRHEPSPNEELSGPAPR